MAYDAILIPGGGVRDNGLVPEWTKRRLDKAVEIFTGKEYLITLANSSPHKSPLLDINGYPIYESVAAARYLMKKGIPGQQILTETSSFDTIGEAYFTRVIHTDPRELKKLAIITSQFQMRRTKVVYEWVFRLLPLRFSYTLSFLEVSDKGIDVELLNLRRRREAKGLIKLMKVKRGIRTLSQFHRWLYTEHEVYATGLKPKRVKGRVLDSY